MMTRMGFRPNENYCDGLHVVYLGGKRLAFTHSAGRLADGFPGDVGVAHPEGGLSVGGLTIEMIEPFKRWAVTYEGECEDTPDGGVLLQRKKERPDGWMAPTPMVMRVEFDATADAFYTADDGNHGHFEQVGNVTGTVTVGDETWDIDARGVRDKSWGARQWSGSGSVRATDPKKEKTPEQLQAEAEAAAAKPLPHIHWFSVTFGDQAALNASCGKGPNGEMAGSGWLQIGDQTQWLKDVVVTSEYEEPDDSLSYDNELLHTTMRLTGVADDGTPVDVVGTVSTICPTKVAMKGGATFINEGRKHSYRPINTHDDFPIAFR